MEWLRYYTDTIDNRKIQDLPPALFKAWVNLLCLARASDGCLPRVEDISFRLRCTEKAAAAWITDLESRHLLDRDGDTIRPHDWDEHQYASDHSGKERVRKHREKQRRNVTRNNYASESVSESVSVSVLGGSGGNPIMRPQRWRSDEQYMLFVADYLGTGAALIDADFAEAFEFCWRNLDFEQKLERVAGLNRHATEYHDDPAFVPRPRKFLESEWARPVKPPRKSADRVSKQQDMVRRIKSL